MKRIGGIFCVVASALLAAYGASAAAQAVAEDEPNYPITSAQPLVFDSNGVAVVNAFMGDADADIFSFQATAGDVVTVDIDGGAKNFGPGHIDTYVTVLHTEAMGYIVIRQDDDALSLDEGSVGPEDTYLANISIPADGVYYVGVTGVGNQVVSGGECRCFSGNLTGTYTLIVSGVSPVATEPDPDPDPTEPGPGTSPFPEQPVEVLTIGIDIKPGQRHVVKVDPKAKGEIPVALLGARDFDVRKVNVDSLKFGRTGDERSLKRCSKRPLHVNRDRRPDLLCFFENQLAGFEASDEEGIVKGVTVDNKPFKGAGILKVIPEKRKHRDRHGERRDRDDDRGRRHRDR